MSDNTKGFTITELLVAISAGSIVAIAVLSISLFFFADVMRNEARATLALESQKLLNAVTGDIKVGSGVRDANQIFDANNTGGWNTSNPDHILIVATPALDSSNDFIIDTDLGEPFMNERIYFEDQGILYRRTLADSTAPGNAANTTCPAAMASPTCPPDAELTDNFNDMTFILYDQNNAVTTITSDTRSVEMTVSMLKNVYGTDIDTEINTRVTMRNP